MCVSALLFLVVTSCDSKDSNDGKRVLRVPDDYGTIQLAVDDARAGDLVLIDKGNYHESIDVLTNDIVIRGVDRNSVVLDGRYQLDNGIRVVKADGVVVENLTVQNYRFNGVFWTGADGYRGSYLTALRNGDYGIYAYASENGLFEHSYAGGSPDAGFYIGQCKPCHALITDVVAENNGFGFSGTNASQDIMIINSTFRHNRAGVAPNSGDGELLAPQMKMVIAGNRVYDNNNANTPAIGSALRSMGIGIIVAGGSDNLIENNWIDNHSIAGIAVVETIDSSRHVARGNKVTRNSVSNSGIVDLAIGSSTPLSNCFSDNIFSSSTPRNIETVAPCPSVNRSSSNAMMFDFAGVSTRVVPPAADRSFIADPPPQRNMPDALSSPATAAPRVSPTSSVTLSTIVRPGGP